MLTANGTKMIKINSLNYLQLLCQRRPHWVRAKDLPALPSLRTLPPSGGANSSKISSKKKIQDHPCLYFDITFFSSLPLGSRLRHSIAAYQYWNFQFQQPESAYIQVLPLKGFKSYFFLFTEKFQFSFSSPRGSSIGLYARRNAIPTLTNNDIRDVLIGFR